MKKYLALVTASLIGLAGVTSASAADAVAHGNHEAKTDHVRKHAPKMHKMHKKGELPRELQDLDLSSKQKAQIQKIMEANRPQQPESRPAPDAAKRAEFQQKMQQHRAAEQSLITGKHFDEAAARRLVEERHAQFERDAAERKQRITDMEVKRLKERHDIFQVLTAKQQKQLLDKQQQRLKEREARRLQRHNAMPHGQHHPQPVPAPQN